jgi:hypothetical protein
MKIKNLTPTLSFERRGSRTTFPFSPKGEGVRG